ncbi:MAG: hypothetical protein AAGA93_24100 [Actinomycetota bacterium]
MADGPDPQLRAQLGAWIDELDRLVMEEYDVGLLDVLDQPERLRRHAGVQLKAPLGAPTPIDPERSGTGAARAWEWDYDKVRDEPADPGPEYLVIAEAATLQYGGPSAQARIDLALDAEHERGLFKIVTSWIRHRLGDRDGDPTLRELYGAEESKREAALLDLADLLANFALTPIYVAALPAGGYLVPILLLAAKHGYGALFEDGGGPDESF